MSTSEQRERDLINRMTAAMREADETFQRVGGSTRHHIRDCLLPILSKHQLVLKRAEDRDPCEACERVYKYGF